MTGVWKWSLAFGVGLFLVGAGGGAEAPPRPLFTLAGHKGGVGAFAFSPDSKRLISCGEDGFVRVWDLGSGKELFHIEEAGEILWGLCLGADGRTLVVQRNEKIALDRLVSHLCTVG